MRYTIRKGVSSMMPNFKIGQKAPKLPQKRALLSLKNVREPLVLMFFPVICAHVGCSEIHHPYLFLRIFVPKLLVI